MRKDWVTAISMVFLGYVATALGCVAALDRLVESELRFAGDAAISTGDPGAALQCAEIDGIVTCAGMVLTGDPLHPLCRVVVHCDPECVEVGREW